MSGLQTGTRVYW